MVEVQLTVKKEENVKENNINFQRVWNNSTVLLPAAKDEEYLYFIFRVPYALKLNSYVVSNHGERQLFKVTT
jgi:hypothetical protein